jgi:hypothetical protein
MRVQREGAQLQARGIWSAGQGDDKERFLADLRALRDEAALGYDELAARAHYPSDILKEAEHGPTLPGLPILAAYVRACDGDVPEWEERWRCLGFEAGAELGLPVRPAGASPAAVAGARAGVTVAPPDVYDPDRIRAALRGQRGYTEPAAQRTAHQETAAASLASWGTAAAPSGTSDNANGNHHPGLPGAGLFDARGTGTPDQAASPPGIRHDPFSASWLQDSELTSPLPQDARLAAQDPASSERAWRPADVAVTQPKPADGGPAPRWDTGGPASPAPGDFWTPSAAATTPADLQRPGPALSPTEEQSGPASSWSPPAETPASSTPGLAHWSPPAETPASSTPGLAQRAVPELPRRSVPDPRAGAAPAAAALPQTPAASADPHATSNAPSQSRSDRLFPVRLLVVIVVAALIGSVLVMLLRLVRPRSRCRCRSGGRLPAFRRGRRPDRR